jgi:hypothetical protein
MIFGILTLCGYDFSPFKFQNLPSVSEKINGKKRARNGAKTGD